MLEITGKRLPIDCFVDNKSLCENLYSTKSVEEKRLRLDIASIRELLAEKLIRSVVWIPTSQQISDCFTKRGATSQKLISVLISGSLNTEEFV